LSEIEASVVEATGQDVARIKPSRIPIEMGRARSEQPDLLAFVLAATEGMGPGVSELAGFIYIVLWRAFRGDTRGKMKQVTAGAIQRRLEHNEQELMRLDGTDPQLVDDGAIAQLTRQPAAFRYVLESIARAEEDENEPVAMSPEEKGSLVLILKTAIDTLDEARADAEGKVG
jgi:hypothetical protein